MSASSGEVLWDVETYGVAFQRSDTIYKSLKCLPRASDTRCRPAIAPLSRPDQNMCTFSAPKQKSAEFCGLDMDRHTWHWEWYPQGSIRNMFLRLAYSLLICAHLQPTFRADLVECRVIWAYEVCRPKSRYELRPRVKLTYSLTPEAVPGCNLRPPNCPF